MVGDKETDGEIDMVVLRIGLLETSREKVGKWEAEGVAVPASALTHP